MAQIFTYVEADLVDKLIYFLGGFITAALNCSDFYVATAAPVLGDVDFERSLAQPFRASTALRYRGASQQVVSQFFRAGEDSRCNDSVTSELISSLVSEAYGVPLHEPLLVTFFRSHVDLQEGVHRSEAIKDDVTEISSAMPVTVLFIISKLSPQVLIRVWHQKAFKEEGMGVAALVWPRAGRKACLGVMHTKSWCSSCYLWITWSHLASELQERYFSSSVGRGYISTSNIFLNMNIFPLNHCGVAVITSIYTLFFFKKNPELLSLTCCQCLQTHLELKNFSFHLFSYSDSLSLCVLGIV